MSDYLHQRETFAGAIDEARPLAEADWNEMIPYKHAVGYDLNEEQYVQLEKSGALRVYTTRLCGKLVGYLVYTILPGGIHSKHSKRAVCLDWWLAPEHRRGGNGIQMMVFAEEQLKGEGIGMMSTPIMAHSDAAAAVLEHLGHELMGKTFMKILGEVGHA